MGELYTVEEFWKFTMRVGLVRAAERVPGSKKLLKLEVDFGDEVRTVVAGVADRFGPEDFVRKKMIFVTNLKPKKVFGIESQAMLLVAEDKDGRLYLVTVGDEVPAGSKFY